MEKKLELPGDLDSSRCELLYDDVSWEEAKYTVNYRMQVGWTHSRVIEYDYAIHWLRYMSAFDAWQQQHGYRGFDGDAEFRQVWANR